MYRYTGTHSRGRTLSLSLSLSLTCTHMHAHAHKHTHTHAHTHYAHTSPLLTVAIDIRRERESKSLQHCVLRYTGAKYRFWGEIPVKIPVRLSILVPSPSRKPEYREKTPDDELQEMPHTKAEIPAPTETQTPTLALATG